MRPAIPFISRYSEAVAKTWLTHLGPLLPEERLVLPGSMSPTERSACTFAIVAGPEAEHLLGFDSLEWVHSTWAGVEALAQVLPKGVDIVRLIDPQLTERMSEAVLAWTLFLHRRMPEYARQQKAQIWQQLNYQRPEETRVGILGLGELGKAAALRLVRNYFQVLGWSRTQKAIDGIECYAGALGFEQIMKQSDIIVCLLPLTPSTQGMLNTAAFAKARAGAAFMNFARGPIVQTDALLQALTEGQLRHAVLDVFEQEPLPKENLFWQHPQITVLPHISAVTDPASASEIVAANVRRWRQSSQRPPSVNRDLGY